MSVTDTNLREDTEPATTHLEPATLPPAESVEPVSPGVKSVQDRVHAFIADLTPTELARLPVDGAEQHDHYVYGTPKKP